MDISKEVFFEAIFKQYLTEYNGFIETREFIPNQPAKIKFHKTVDGVIQYVPEGNFYFGVCPRSKESGATDAIEMITALWVDIDAKEQTKEEIIVRLNDFKYAPSSIIVDSGNGVHVYWLLKQPEKIRENTKGVLKGLAKALGGDHCFDLPRILRVPGSLNLKDPANPKETTIISFNPDLRYNLDDFDHFYVCPDDAKAKNIAFSANVNDIDINKLNIQSNVRALILSGKKDGDEYRSRSEADFYVVCHMLERGYSYDDIKAVFCKYPIGEKYWEQGDAYLKYTIGKARAKIEKQTSQPTQVAAKSVSPDCNPVYIAKKVMQNHRIINCAEDFYEYRDGCYRLTHVNVIRKWIAALLGYKTNMNRIKDVLYCLESMAHVDIEKLNEGRCLNLKNGLFDIDNHVLLPHSPDVYSTIQLEVSYDPNAKREKWIKMLNEIFEGNGSKIGSLQEYLGVCFTKEIKYEKALMLLGDGANGKSTILYILERMLGVQNYSAIPLEKFDNSHYLASLFNKLVNICSETNAKSGIYDSSFKRIISGDTLEADYKFKNSFKFKPYCKLIFAVNNMPRVDDKSEALFRRLLIVRFNRAFSEQEQNKNLKYELIEELDGIFLWCLEGLKRLGTRGYFELTTEMKNEINEYKKENNSVLMFKDEELTLRADLSIEKGALYTGYTICCSESGCHPLSKIRFGKELCKLCPEIRSDRGTDGIHIWVGIGILTDKEKKKEYKENEKRDKKEVMVAEA